jgi:hypothetical protein
MMQANCSKAYSPVGAVNTVFSIVVSTDACLGQASSSVSEALSEHLSRTSSLTHFTCMFSYRYNRVSTTILKILQSKRALDKPVLVYIIT